MKIQLKSYYGWKDLTMEIMRDGCIELRDKNSILLLRRCISTEKFNLQYKHAMKLLYGDRIYPTLFECIVEQLIGSGYIK